MNVARTLDAVVIGGSAGSVTALASILPQLPADFAPVLVVVHVLRSHPSLLAELFEPITAGTIYFAPADYHLLVEPDRRCSLSIEAPVLFSRPAIDVLFESAANAYGAGLVGIVLSGSSSDGAEGLQSIHQAGGRTMIQDHTTAEARTMPTAALAAVPSARVLPVSAMASELLAYRESNR
ncbi:MAG: chemotaxis protein CheB [Proteobacteria bacterium]|nr:MAG: chemotaxis protein CheB [Pseudomonadota bacterium]